MANSMIEINNRLFARLSDVAGEKLTVEAAKFPRAISTDKDGKDWLKHAKVTKMPHLALGPRAEFAIANFKERFFLVCVGIEVNPCKGSDLIKISPNSGALTLFLADLELPLLDKPDLQYALLEHVFIPPLDKADKFIAIDVESVKKFFAKIELFEIRKDSVLISEYGMEYRVALAALLDARAARPLDWNVNTLERLAKMVMNPDEKAPFHLLFRMLTENRGDSAFLDIYRCIEQLFPLPKISVLCGDLGIVQSEMEVAKKLELHLGWRRSEIESLTHLMSEAPKEILEKLRIFLNIYENGSDLATVIAKSIYEFRNRSVHFRAIHADALSKAPPDWLGIVDVLLEFVEILYLKNSKSFSEIKLNKIDHEADIFLLKSSSDLDEHTR